jgi:hypothetical protein
MEPNNPYGSGTPASNTMTVQRQISGGRTRNVINLAEPGSTTAKCYAFAATNSAPTAAGEGFTNFRQQSTLHVVVDNNRNTGNATLEFYFYSSSLGGGWSKLAQAVRVNNADTLTFAEFPTITVTAGASTRFILPIEGIEKIAVHCSAIAGASGTCDVYMGVNTI